MWERICTLLVHALLYGVFVVGFGGVLECAAEACRCHIRGLGGRVILVKWSRSSREVCEFIEVVAK
jgi:hypothetical protein